MNLLVTGLFSTRYISIRLALNIMEITDLHMGIGIRMSMNCQLELNSLGFHENLFLGGQRAAGGAPALESRHRRRGKSEGIIFEVFICHFPAAIQKF